MNFVFRRAFGALLQPVKHKQRTPVRPTLIRTAANASIVEAVNNLSEEEFVDQFAQKYPKETNLKNVSHFYRNISGCGINSVAAMKMLVTHPSILSMPADTLEDNLLGWLSLQFGDELCTILTSHPYLLCVKQQNLSARYTKIVSVFSQRKVAKLILLNPMVVTEDWRRVLDKIEFMRDKFGLTLSEIISAGSLNYPFRHIRDRLEFLHKAGMFVIPKPKTPPANRPNNPPLKETLGLPPNLFAVNIAGLTGFEFEVFQQLSADEEPDDFSDLSDSED